MTDDELKELYKQTIANLCKIIMHQTGVEDTKGYQWLTDYQSKVYLGSRDWLVASDTGLVYLVNAYNTLKYGESAGLEVEKQDWEDKFPPCMEYEYY